jgi:hypothetical protein
MNGILPSRTVLSVLEVGGKVQVDGISIEIA